MFNYNFRNKNRVNSYSGVICIAKDICMDRRSTLCNCCKNNIGANLDRRFFKLKWGIKNDNSKRD